MGKQITKTIIQQRINVLEKKYPNKSHLPTTIRLMFRAWKGIIEPRWDPMPCYSSLSIQSINWCPRCDKEKISFNITDDRMVYSGGYRSINEYLLCEVQTENKAYNILIESAMHRYGQKFILIICILNVFQERGIVKDCSGLILNFLFQKEVEVF